MILVPINDDLRINFDEVDFMQTDRHTREDTPEVETFIQFRSGHYMVVKDMSAKDIEDAAISAVGAGR